MGTATTKGPRTTRSIAGLTAFAAVIVLALGMLPSAAQDPPPPIDVEPLTARHTFTDDVTAQLRSKPDGRAREVVNLRDASRMQVVRITVQPQARFPWHTHPGPVLVAVNQGELVYVYADDCRERPYPAGTGFVDPGGGNVHTAFNPTDEETVLIATFLGAPASGGLTLPVAPEEGAALDQSCGLEASSQAH
jgi:quercetin dioxygenase-like cupin family protein